jgi:hypothetical protein
MRGDIILSLTKESLLVFGELSNKWQDFLGLYSQRPHMLVKHCRRLSNRSQLVISLKKSQSLVASSLKDKQVLTNLSYAIGIPA